MADFSEVLSLPFAVTSFSQTAGQASVALNPVQTEDIRGQQPSIFLAGLGVCVESPEPTLLRPPSAGLDRQRSSPVGSAQPGTFSEAQLPLYWQGQKGASVCRVWAHNGLCPGPECFHQHQFISVSPHSGWEPGAAERERHCPTPRTCYP